MLYNQKLKFSMRKIEGSQRLLRFGNDSVLDSCSTDVNSRVVDSPLETLVRSPQDVLRERNNVELESVTIRSYEQRYRVGSKSGQRTSPREDHSLHPVIFFMVRVLVFFSQT